MYLPRVGAARRHRRCAQGAQPKHVCHGSRLPGPTTWRPLAAAAAATSGSRRDRAGGAGDDDEAIAHKLARPSRERPPAATHHAATHHAATQQPRHDPAAPSLREPPPRSPRAQTSDATSAMLGVIELQDKSAGLGDVRSLLQLTQFLATLRRALAAVRWGPLPGPLSVPRCATSPRAGPTAPPAACTPPSSCSPPTAHKQRPGPAPTTPPHDVPGGCRYCDAELAIGMELSVRHRPSSGENRLLFEQGSCRWGAAYAVQAAAAVAWSAVGGQRAMQRHLHEQMPLQRG